jgi:hypothetical protein
MKKRVLFGCSIVLAINTWAQAPEIFRYQGRLVEGTNLVNATLPMSFKLYDAPSSGNLLYEDSSSVLVVDGLYATDIGDNTVFGSLAKALTNTAVYLELTVDGETLSPRERLVSVPYALNTKADPTPAGTIVFSETHPNPELEAQGYSLYYEDVLTADWEAVDNSPYFDSYSGKVFGFGNQLGILSANPESKVYLTDNGKSWDEGNCPIYFGGYSPKIAEFNDVLYFFSSDYGNVACSTADLQTWTTWTNAFSTNMYDTFYVDEVVVFKDALWAFVRNSYPSNFVMRSTDGMSWTQMSSGPWGDLSMSGEVIASDEKLLVSSVEPLSYSNHVWSSTDGISWSMSTTATPSYMQSTELVFHENALWSFFQNASYTGGECWKSLNDGDSWSLVTTNLPNYTIMGRYRVATHADKLWIWGNDSMAMRGAVLWSTDAISGQTSLDCGNMGESATLVSLPNGRLWFYKGNDALGGPSFYFIGGPKKLDGLYYYRKD